jgi:hypothetical protein
MIWCYTIVLVYKGILVYNILWMKYRFRRLDGRVEVKQHISERTLNSMSKVYWKFDIKILKKKSWY